MKTPDSDLNKAYKPIIFVSGKGGVGKSVISAALGLHLASQGKKVLLVELGEKSFFEKFFQNATGDKSITFKPTEVAANFHIAIWDFKAVLKEYVSFYIRSEKLYDIFFGNPMMQRLIQAAPALKELAILGKATSAPRGVGPKLDYDHIIVDSYSTGHHLALLKAPIGISQVIHKGPMGVQSESILKVIRDPQLFQQIVVIKPEELPTVEGLELQDNLKKDLKIDCSLVCNQILEFPLNGKEFETEINQAQGETKDFVSELSQVFFEQKACIEKLSRKDPSFVSIPFCFDNSNKLGFVGTIGKNFGGSK